MSNVPTAKHDGEHRRSCRWACIWFVVIVAGGGTRISGFFDANSYEAAIKSLAEGTDGAIVKRAVQTLNQAEIKAFPTLIAHIKDNTPASARRFWGDARSLGRKTVAFLERRLEQVQEKKSSTPLRP